LSGRGASGPAATALAISSGSNLGPAVDMANLTRDADEEFRVEGEDDVSDSELSGSDEGMYEEEGEEEEEGLESSEEMSDV